MPTFEYIALDRNGKKSKGSIAAESPAAARRLLRNRKLMASKVRPISDSARSGSTMFESLFTGGRREQVLEFTRQLGTMVNADVKLTEALSILIAQAHHPRFIQIIQNIRDEVLAGESLADILKEYPGWFDSIYISMIRVGEATGNLGRSLSLLADYMGKRQRLEAKLKSALTYPMVLVFFCVVVVVFLMTVVIPRIAKIIEGTGQELPGITKFMIDFSHLLLNYWWLAILLIVFVGWLFSRILSTQKGRLMFDSFLLKIPVTGELLRQSIVARFTSTLAALIRSGLPMADSLQAVSATTGNAVMFQAIQQARDRIIAGADVATPLRESNVVGPAIAHMIAVGEKSGELESMLITVSESIEESSDLTIQKITATIEPIIIVFMAVIVGLIIYSVMLPILQVSDISSF